MSKLIASLFVSLDGVMEAPETWHFPYFNEEMGAAIEGAMSSTGAFLLGRQTYQEFAEFWPNQSADEPFAEFMNGTQKYVASTTLAEVDWQNSTLLGPDLASEVSKLEEQVDGDISVTGSAMLVRWLLREGLLDELRLMVHPIVVGSGKRLFEDDDTGNTPLELVESQTFSTGVLNLAYRPAKS